MAKILAALLGVCVLGLVAAGVAVMQEEITFDQPPARESEQAAVENAPPAATPSVSSDDAAAIALLRGEVGELKALIQELAALRVTQPVAYVPSNEGSSQMPVTLDEAVIQAVIDQAIGNALKRHEEWKAAEAQRKQDEAQREYQEMLKGPYGEHNYAVNYFGKQYGLNASQKDQYYNLLKWQAEEYKKVQEWYQDEWARMQETGISSTSKEYRNLTTEYQQRYKDIQGRLDSDMSRILTAEQYDRYKSGGGAYPNWHQGQRESLKG